MTIQTITSVGQKRSYPVARNLAARTTFSDADAAQVVDAYTSFAAAEKKVMTAVRSLGIAVLVRRPDPYQDDRRCTRNCTRGPGPADA
jgi:hypothetical protein